ncbi:MAG: septal ring lytic transglycosylase RlpA family protein [Gammaproteobacteria bacterium]|nr:septal ring lytic transglycosylase RlpA family protein [Gammaproteobacteria bacterium]
MKIFIPILSLLLLAGCVSTESIPVVSDSAPTQTIDVSKIHNAVPKVEPKSHYGNPNTYVVNGQSYSVLQSAANYDKKGVASWYGTKFNGQLTSTRESYDMFAMTAASTELPLPTYVKVTDLENGHKVIVKVNDRGPFDKNRLIDLSYAAAKKLGFANKGTALVEVQAIDPHHYNTKPDTPKTTTAPAWQPHLYLQVASFNNSEHAKQLQTRLSQLTTEPTYVDSSLYHDKPIYRVQIGPLANVTANDQLQKILHKEGLSAITVIK